MATSFQTTATGTRIRDTVSLVLESTARDYYTSEEAYTPVFNEYGFEGNPMEHGGTNDATYNTWATTYGDGSRSYTSSNVSASLPETITNNNSPVVAYETTYTQEAHPIWTDYSETVEITRGTTHLLTDYHSESFSLHSYTGQSILLGADGVPSAVEVEVSYRYESGRSATHRTEWSSSGSTKSTYVGGGGMTLYPTSSHSFSVAVDGDGDDAYLETSAMGTTYVIPLPGAVSYTKKTTFLLGDTSSSSGTLGSSSLFRLTWTTVASAFGTHTSTRTATRSIITGTTNPDATPTTTSTTIAYTSTTATGTTSSLSVTVSTTTTTSFAVPYLNTFVGSFGLLARAATAYLPDTTEAVVALTATDTGVLQQAYSDIGVVQDGTKLVPVATSTYSAVGVSRPGTTFSYQSSTNRTQSITVPTTTSGMAVIPQKTVNSTTSGNDNLMLRTLATVEKTITLNSHTTTGTTLTLSTAIGSISASGTRSVFSIFSSETTSSAVTFVHDPVFNVASTTYAEVVTVRWGTTLGTTVTVPVASDTLPSYGPSQWSASAEGGDHSWSYTLGRTAMQTNTFGTARYLTHTNGAALVTVGRIVPVGGFRLPSGLEDTAPRFTNFTHTKGTDSNYPGASTTLASPSVTCLSGESLATASPVSWESVSTFAVDLSAAQMHTIGGNGARNSVGGIFEAGDKSAFVIKPAGVFGLRYTARDALGATSSHEVTHDGRLVLSEANVIIALAPIARVKQGPTTGSSGVQANVVTFMRSRA